MEKTAFTTNYGQYEYTVAALGLCHAPATFQTLMNSIFRDVIDDFMVVYLDDLLIFSKTAEEHEAHVYLVLNRLRENQLYVSPKKCSFFQPEVKFLGLLDGRNGIRVDPENVEVIKNWPRPEHLTEIRGFLGLVQLFKRFIKTFSELARRLTGLTKKTKGITAWKADCDDSFKTLKASLMNAPILVAPDWEKPFILHVDASQFAFGRTLTHKD